MAMSKETKHTEKSMKIIAFGHQKGVGKDTSAGFLNTILRIAAPQLIIKHVSFASKLKDVCYQLYGWAGLKPGIYYETHYREKNSPLSLLNGLSPRDLWIGVGNGLREVWESTWIDYALKGVKADIIIVSDLRFENEAIAVREANGTLIKLLRDVPRGTDAAETDLLNWTDWVQIIDNNGTLDRLNAHMEILAQDILEEINET